MSRSIILYRPSPATFPVSITGGRCELNCPHCEGRYLEGMERAIVVRSVDIKSPAESPQELETSLVVDLYVPKR